MFDLFCWSLRRLFPVLLSLWALPASAQTYLTQAEVETLLRDNIVCYEPGANGSCATVEMMDEFGGAGTVTYIGFLFGDGELGVVRQESTWINDALCIRGNDLGMVEMRTGTGPTFFFDRRGLSPDDPVLLGQLIEFLLPDAQPKTCFRYTQVPGQEGRYEQHEFSEGARIPGVVDRVALIPLSQGSVQLQSGN